MSAEPDTFDTRWPSLLPAPAARGMLRTEPEDFEVEELPAYPLSGEGEHLFLWLEKRLRTTDQVVRDLAAGLGVSADEIGSAGLKDRRAVTRQWLSVPARAAERLAGLELAGARVLESRRHGNKLRTGHLRGNRFRLLVRGVDPGQAPELTARAEELRRRGAPNYFGPQRFGRGLANEAEGRAVLAGRGRRHDRRGLRFVLNAAQAALFNDLLARRLRADLLSRVLEGDLLLKADSGGQFLCCAPAEDQPRADRFEVHPTGPMFGPKMRAPQGVPASMEAEVLSAAGIGPETFQRFAKLTQGTRRSLRLALPDLELSFEPAGLRLAFSLPAGAYATVVLRELLQVEEPAEEGAEHEQADGA
ncbi:MAG TPA: tRNA pseudouridine(13) synthase TruD [Myxococcota bacterium]|nr:tRNA pseudouridine(13) synthase TruD [Myxococcota bacterium]HRY94463.1 tRNA pseudouridine(13) synthase TruD [Myxococcota bacterium]HSA21498.1 tRNA pseudouridine(13) synthase TruD [Myxococcota bacterium]